MKLQTTILPFLLMLAVSVLTFGELAAQRPDTDENRLHYNFFDINSSELQTYDGIRPGDKGEEQITTALSITGSYSFDSANESVKTYVIHFTVHDILGDTEVSLSSDYGDLEQTNFSLSASDEGELFSTEINIPSGEGYQQVHVFINATSLIQPGNQAIVTIDGLRSSTTVSY